MRVVGMVLVVVSACSFEHGAVSPDGRPMTGSDADDGAMPDMAVPLGPWGAPVEVIASGVGDDDPSLTDDMTEMYFGSRRIPNSASQGDENIWVVTRAKTSDAWSVPSPVTELNTAYTETTIKITGDGLTIFFASDRASGDDADLFYSTRPDRSTPWSQPALVPNVNSSDGDYAAYAQASLTHLVFCSGPSTAGEALYVSDRGSATAAWSTPVRISELDDAAVSEGDPMEPHAGVMYYDSWIGNADKTYDIYRVERPTSTSQWGNRTKVEGISSDSHHDRDPWVSADERTMYFSSTRDGSGFDKIYMSTR